MCVCVCVCVCAEEFRWYCVGGLLGMVTRIIVVEALKVEEHTTAYIYWRLYNAIQCPIFFGIGPTYAVLKYSPLDEYDGHEESLPCVCDWL